MTPRAGLPRSRRRRIWAAVAAGVGLLVILVGAGVYLTAPAATVRQSGVWPPFTYYPPDDRCDGPGVCGPSPTDAGEVPHGAAVRGCVVYPAEVQIPPGEALTVDVSVTYGRCVTTPRPVEPSGGDTRSGATPTADPDPPDARGRRDELDHGSALRPPPPIRGEPVGSPVVVGGIARLSFVAPSFPGTIGAVSSEEQRIREVDDSGSWSWDIQPDRPGEYEMSLVLSILAEDGKELLKQNDRIKVWVLVPDNPAYRIGQIWTGFLAFGTSAAGILTASAGAVAAVLALVPYFKRRKEAVPARPPDQDPPGSGGYV